MIKRIPIFLFICFMALTNICLIAQNFKLPEYTKFKLDNGLTIYLMEQHDVPLISVSGIFPAGAIYDGKQEGLALLTAASLKHGTENYTKAEIDETLDFLGANLNVSAAKEYASLTSKFAEKDKKTVLSIIKDVLRHPVFNKEEFDKEKSRFLTSLERNKESPRDIIESYFDRLLFADHVYATSLTGSKKSVESIQIKDVIRFYKGNYIPNNAAISLVGDFNIMEMKALITSLFSDWKKGNVNSEQLESKPIQTPQTGTVLLVNKEDAKETTFYIGGPGVARNNDDFVAIQVVNTLFGGRFTSMLNSELRVNSGLTYRARSKFESYKNGGSFHIGTFTANETTEQAIDLALEVLNKLHTTGLDEKSLTSAKNYVKGQFPPDYETTDQLSLLLLDMFWYDFDENFINGFENNVEDLTVEKSKKIITTYFPSDHLQFVLIGKASEIETIAGKYGPVIKRDIKE